MNDHLSPALMNALADGELAADQLASANQHLAACSSCAANALQLSLLKSATSKAGRRYAPPHNLQERLVHRLRQQTSLPESSPIRTAHQPMREFRVYAWASACAALLVFVSILVQHNMQHSALDSSQYASLVTEVCDQHIATLAANAPPQVISSDRHTVKPWFQGRIPFSFNLPENLPAGTTLDGANLTYIHNQPTAQLLYSIGKHHVSVYVQQKTAATIPNQPLTDHLGFHVASFTTSDLDVLAVSDVDPPSLSNLVELIKQSQASTTQAPK
jgi:anti-sigma factor RsiW